MKIACITVLAFLAAFFLSRESRFFEIEGTPCENLEIMLSRISEDGKIGQGEHSMLRIGAVNGFELKKFSIPREKNLRLRLNIFDDVKIKGFRTYRKIGLLPFYFDLRSEDLAGAAKAGSSGPVKLEDGICVGGAGSSLTLQISDFPEKGWRSSLLFSSLLFSSPFSWLFGGLLFVKTES
ncbi:MAG: hypothetical protein LBG65_05670 [Puniceicoccales bacterium]|jgi:hypothetical protein|nr:hypothetical protein [Puniceicoccales bacterium]